MSRPPLGGNLFSHISGLNWIFFSCPIILWNCKYTSAEKKRRTKEVHITNVLRLINSLFWICRLWLLHCQNPSRLHPLRIDKSVYIDTEQSHFRQRNIRHINLCGMKTEHTSQYHSQDGCVLILHSRALSAGWEVENTFHARLSSLCVCAKPPFLFVARSVEHR